MQEVVSARQMAGTCMLAIHASTTCAHMPLCLDPVPLVHLCSLQGPTLDGKVVGPSSCGILWGTWCSQGTRRYWYRQATSRRVQWLHQHRCSNLCSWAHQSQPHSLREWRSRRLQAGKHIVQFTCSETGGQPTIKLAEWRCAAAWSERGTCMKASLKPR